MANRSEKILNLSADVLSPRKMGKKESRKRPISQNAEKKKLKIDAEPSEKLTPFSKSTFETGIKNILSARQCRDKNLKFDKKKLLDLLVSQY